MTLFLCIRDWIWIFSRSAIDKNEEVSVEVSLCGCQLPTRTDQVIYLLQMDGGAPRDPNIVVVGDEGSESEGDLLPGGGG